MLPVRTKGNKTPKMPLADGSSSAFAFNVCIATKQSKARFSQGEADKNVN
jgi:hypothetical protein